MFDVAALARAPSAGPRSILRLLQVFARLGACPEGQTLAQLCEALDVPKTTLFTMLKVLDGADYLAQSGGVYRLGPAAVALGASMSQGPSANFPDCAHGTLESLARRTGETGFLAVLSADRLSCRYLAVVESENWLRYSVQLGSQKPAYATGTGRAMLAYLPAADLRELMPQFRFERLTALTVPSRRALAAALKEVRQRGSSVVDSGTVAGVVSVAAPVFAADGRLMAAVSAGGPSTRVAGRLRAVETAVRDAAAEISTIVGYRGAWPP